MTLEDLQPGASVRGIFPDAAVSVVSVQWHGSDALTLVYRDPSGRVADEILYRHDEARLAIVGEGRPWSFDGDGALFRLVAEAHRILMRGGVFMYPRDRKDLTKPGRLRLLYEANPIGMIVEQAGGRASTGYEPILGVVPDSLHQRIGLVFGARAEVERIERYHRDHNEFEYEAPLFANRGLLRDLA